MSKLTFNDVKKLLHQKSHPDRVEAVSRFFKTGKGEYGEGDKFIGVFIPDVRSVARISTHLPLTDVLKFMKSKIHEERILAVLILVKRYPSEPEKIYNFYIKHRKHVNNWDLVDISCKFIVGHYTYHNNNSDILKSLSSSESLWDRRISVVSTLYHVSQKQLKVPIQMCQLLIDDEHDLIRKAVGWCLREVGKVDVSVLDEFLEKNIKRISSITLSYAMEKFDKKKKDYYRSKR